MRGFTLIEVLIALVILAIALSAIIAATGDTANSLSRVQSTMISHWVADNVLSSEQSGIIPPPQQGKLLTGTSQIHNKTWYWTSGIDLTSAKSPYTLRVYVSVTDKKDGAQISKIIGFITTHPER